MGLRSAAVHIPLLWRPTPENLARRTPRYFSDGSGRFLRDLERTAENFYIQKMERERMEKLRRFQVGEGDPEAQKAVTGADASFSFAAHLSACIQLTELE